VIYVPSFIKIGSGDKKLIRWLRGHTQAHTYGQQRDVITLFFQNEESRLKRTEIKF
jgi:hypothetical protein